MRQERSSLIVSALLGITSFFVFVSCSKREVFVKPYENTFENKTIEKQVVQIPI